MIDFLGVWLLLTFGTAALWNAVVERSTKLTFITVIGMGLIAWLMNL